MYEQVLGGSTDEEKYRQKRGLSKRKTMETILNRALEELGTLWLKNKLSRFILAASR